MYDPKPAIVEPEDLPVSLQPALESIARQVHDVWAAGRMNEGWRYGAHLDEAQKTHPSLRPYEELSRAEQDYDRRTAAQTIACLLRMGYRIEKDPA